MVRIAVILGSTRPGRLGEQVARWVLGIARARRDAEFDLIDLAEEGLPLLDEPIPPSAHRYTHPHTKAWSQKIASYDGFVFVTGEYNHSIPAALKNAIDFLYTEWNDKAAGFVSYGSAGGVRAVEQLRGVMGELQVADVRANPALSIADDFEEYVRFKPRDSKAASVATMLDQVVAWSQALHALRSPRVEAGRFVAPAVA